MISHHSVSTLDSSVGVRKGGEKAGERIVKWSQREGKALSPSVQCDLIVRSVVLGRMTNDWLTWHNAAKTQDTTQNAFICRKVQLKNRQFLDKHLWCVLYERHKAITSPFLVFCGWCVFHGVFLLFVNFSISINKNKASFIQLEFWTCQS